MNEKVNPQVVDTLVQQYAEYLVTTIHAFIAARTEDPDAVVPEYNELLSRIGVLSARSAVAYIVNPLVTAGSFDGEALEQFLDQMYAELEDNQIQGLAEDEARVRRAQYLLEAIPDRQEKYGQLFPDEVEPMRELVRRGEAASREELQALLPELEQTWITVQPGIRVYRGDADWMAALQRHLDESVDRLKGQDLENHLIQKALLTYEGSAEIRGKARDLLANQIDALEAEKEATEAQLASYDTTLRSLREKRRALI